MRYILTTKKYRRLLRSLSIHNIKAQLVRLVALLLVLLALHALAMVYFEGVLWGDAIWLTLTTVTTVGYGDFSALTPIGRSATAVLIYGFGIAILAQVATLYFEFRQQRRTSILKGNWKWDMEDHILFLNSPKENPTGYFLQAISQLRNSAHKVGKKPVLIVSDNFPNGIEDDIRALAVAHVNRSVLDKQAFLDSHLSKAAVVVILCHDAQDPLCDSLNFDTLSRVREANPYALIVVEIVSDDNRPRLLKAGADHVVRPIRSYPELLIRTILAPGSEKIFEDLFDSSGEECLKYTIEFKGKWGDIASKLISYDIGTPLAYANRKGGVITNPPPAHEVDAIALYILVRAGNIKSENVVKRLLNKT